MTHYMCHQLTLTNSYKFQRSQASGHPSAQELSMTPSGSAVLPSSYSEFSQSLSGHLSPNPHLQTLYTHSSKQATRALGNPELESWLCCMPEYAVCLLVSLNISQRPVLGLCTQDTEINKTCFPCSQAAERLLRAPWPQFAHLQNGGLVLVLLYRGCEDCMHNKHRAPSRYVMNARSSCIYFLDCIFAQTFPCLCPFLSSLLLHGQYIFKTHTKSWSCKLFSTILTVPQISYLPACVSLSVSVLFPAVWSNRTSFCVLPLPALLCHVFYLVLFQEYL